MSKKTIGTVLLEGCRCRCGHEWLPRVSSEKPRVCPKCKSPNWDRPKLFERNGRKRVSPTGSRGR
jgi:predicted Zn-ribbon and HTH transcriptional regulator